MTRNKAVRAVFGTTLNTTVVGGGSLVIEPGSPWCPYGTEVLLTAVPAIGNYLAFWANGGGHSLPTQHEGGATSRAGRNAK